MDTKKIIFGTLGLAVIGGGVWFYLKNRKSSSTSALKNALSSTASAISNVMPSSSSLASSTTSNSTFGTSQLDTTTSATATTQNPKEDDAKTLALAQGYGSQIQDLRNQQTPLKQITSKDCMQKQGGGTYSIFDTGFMSCNNEKSMASINWKQLQDKITSLQTLLAGLGYKESYGNVSKI